MPFRCTCKSIAFWQSCIIFRERGQIGFSSVMLAAAITKVEDPRLVIPVHIAHVTLLGGN